MSVAVSQCRDSRRRLVVPWHRSAATPSSAAATPSAGKPRRPIEYAAEALPEHQPSLATLLPTSLAGFALTACGLLAVVAAALGVGVWDTIAGGQLFGRSATRFGATFTAVRHCLDPRTLLSLGGWLAQVCLGIATVTALIVRLMRQHRCDDVRGRSGAWVGMAILFAITAFAGQVPLGEVIASLVSDTTGIALGPHGMGWWLLAAAVLYAAVGLWAVLPLYERAATGLWLGLCLVAWAAAAACGWISQTGTVLGREVASRDLLLVVGNACWMTGAALAAIAMLAAARSVLREVRGLPACTAGRQSKAVTTARPGGGSTTTGDPGVAASLAATEAPSAHDELEADGRNPWRGSTTFVDGPESSDADEDDEQSGRRLSKAERKRLKKLARMGRAA
jgi:hypothetical protein